MKKVQKSFALKKKKKMMFCPENKERTKNKTKQKKQKFENYCLKSKFFC